MEKWALLCACVLVPACIYTKWIPKTELPIGRNKWITFQGQPMDFTAVRKDDKIAFYNILINNGSWYKFQVSVGQTARFRYEIPINGTYYFYYFGYSEQTNGNDFDKEINTTLVRGTNTSNSNSSDEENVVEQCSVWREANWNQGICIIWYGPVQLTAGDTIAPVVLGFNVRFDYQITTFAAFLVRPADYTELLRMDTSSDRFGYYIM